MIINIRGTHGSGKSYIVRQLIQQYKGVATGMDVKGRRMGYRLQLTNGKPLYVVGRYNIACGGCDAIQPYSDIWPRVEKFATLGHVVFEGALISTTYGTIGQASEKYGDEFVFAFLDTPLELCLSRIRARRLAKGNIKELNPHQTTWKHKTILSLFDRFREERGRKTILLDHTKAVSQIKDMLENA